MPKIIDHDERRREIVEVAKRIILKGGFEAATMRSIATEAGFANGALKHYFPGKESIVAATFESILAGMEDAVAAAPAAEPGVQLEHFLRTPMPRTEEEIASGRVLLALWEYAMSNEELAALYRAFLQRWRDSFTEYMSAARDAGAISVDAPYDRLATEYMSVVIGATVVNLMFSNGSRIADFDEYLDSFLARMR
ncbi:MAG: TetR/AcrR family transcriptional regulator [Microbacterium sp.]|uniref:TetR/AcrR family transcriptional regulator n=1 Tax=Microbacterium sp. TaxID=51671 RepID=UPI001AD1A06C|nr:TetR/AcrR family transcriptional regulator [Microbacterium sp.]MBN9178685.1 TetR/AcrR family transcriptional regulator [Microbacterium sp.]